MLSRFPRHLQKFPPKQITVDLDEEKGIKPREGRLNRHKVQIRHSIVVNMAALHAWFSGKMAFDKSVLQAVGRLQ